MNNQAQKDEISKLLSELTAIKPFSPHELELLIDGSEVVSIRRGAVLFDQGDYSNDAYLLINGRLSAVLDWGKENESFLGMVKPGDLVGEMGVILGGARSCFIVAQKDSLLLKINKDDFLAKMQKIPSLLILINRLLTLRLKNTISKIHTRTLPHLIALLPATHSDIYDFLPEFENIVRESKLNACFIDYKAVVDKLGNDYTEQKLNSWLDEIDDKYSFVFYIASPHQKEWFDFVLYRVERVLLLANANSNPKLIPKVEHFLSEKRIGFTVTELVILHSPRSKIRNTSPFLDLFPTERIHHLFRGNKNDYQRLLRFITGNAVGVVLSGGGVRGWVHLGALLALKDAGICIDAIGGTSTGALISSLYLTSQSIREFTQSISYIFDMSMQKIVSWSDYTWPKVSIISSKKLNDKLFNLVGNQKIEDLKIPYFAIASNLNTDQPIIMRSGSIWKAVRCSTSIPGIVPPMMENGQLIVDGGIINNLPTDVMYNYLENKGFIIAVDLSLTNQTDIKYQFPPVLTLADFIKNKFRHKTKQFRLPSIADIIMQSISMGSEQLVQKNKRLADIFIQPQLFGQGMLSYKDPKKLIESGYNETLKQISLWERENGCKLLDHIYRLDLTKN